MKAISSTGNYATTYALLLEEHPAWIGAHGALVAVPNRQALLVYPINDLTVVTAIQKLIFVAGSASLPGPRDGTNLNPSALQPDVDFR